MTQKLKLCTVAILSGLTLIGCGGGGADGVSDSSANTRHGVQLKKSTQYQEDDRIFYVSEYSYNSDRMLSKLVNKSYKGDSEQGELEWTTISTRTYTDKYKCVKLQDEYYDSYGELNHITTTKYTYNHDNLVSLKIKTESFINSDSNVLIEGNASNFVDGIATKSTYSGYDKTPNLLSQSSIIREVNNSKTIKEITTNIDYLNNKKTVVETLYEYDSLNRPILVTAKQPNGTITKKTTYNSTDTNKFSPSFICLGQYLELDKIQKIKYPKSTNICAVASKIVLKYIDGTSTISTYKHTFDNEGLILETKLTHKTGNNLRIFLSKYEYEKY